MQLPLAWTCIARLDLYSSLPLSVATASSCGILVKYSALGDSAACKNGSYNKSEVAIFLCHLPLFILSYVSTPILPEKLPSSKMIYDFIVVGCVSTPSRVPPLCAVTILTALSLSRPSRRMSRLSPGEE